eukprot:gene269-353_t
MSHYDFKAIEQKWQQYWEDNQTYHIPTHSNKPKYYILDMFPYPSGEGLHVGHPLGYIASDIIARYKRSKGYNVLHPMGFDAFGLPAEQFAIQTGQHPATTTKKNIQRYKKQLQQIGLSYDWNRAINTSDPSYYRWTQWIFLCFFHSWYDNHLQKARPIGELITLFEQQGNQDIQASCDKDTPCFTASDWKSMDTQAQQQLLLAYRLAFLEETTVNWCPELGTVLANEEVKDGLSERGGYPVIRKQMKQWTLRITAYADRLLSGLEGLQWPASTKEMQRHWIGRSLGAEIKFNVLSAGSSESEHFTIFTTRPDTVFGVTYIALAPEHPLAAAIGSAEQRDAIASYLAQTTHRSERDRLANVQHITGVFTGAYALHPFTQEPLPIWIADYVLAGYGTGAIMGVPAHDSRDYAFAQHFQLSLRPIIVGSEVQQTAYETTEGILCNSQFLDGLSVQEATSKVIQRLESLGLGKQKTTYRLRNAILSRQRYWGEPIPVYDQDGIPYPLPITALPLELPEITNFQPTASGEPPLGHATHWETASGYPLELNTMPGWAGSSWYFFRYMDPTNTASFVGNQAQQYWQAVDLYLGGSEHATGHLLYARFWTKFLYDLGYVTVQEPFQALIHQGMIQGRSSFVYRIKGTNQFVSYHLRDNYPTIAMHVDIQLVHNNLLDLAGFKKWRPDLATATFILEDGQYICGSEVEKMSKSKYNVVNPDTIIEQYGADTLRLYTMFLGPLEQNKPWDTHGIEGVFRFLTKLWRLFHTAPINTEEAPTLDEQKVIHKTIKKVEEAITRYAFNTAVSHLMVCVNELTTLKCRNQEVLEKLTLLLAPFAPHLAEELWQIGGHIHSITLAGFPTYEPAYVQETYFEYPIAINGKVRTKLTFELSISPADIEAEVLNQEAVQKWLQDNHMDSIVHIVQGTPIKVWIILAYLIYIGMKATKPQRTWISQLFALPLVMIGLSILSLLKQAHGIPNVMWYSYLGSALLGGYMGWLFFKPKPLIIDRSTRSMTLPGDYTTLGLLISIFILHYLGGYMHAIHPHFFTLSVTGYQMASSGRPHLGNILGAMVPTLALASQPTNNTFIFLADLHTLTTIKNAQERHSHVHAAAAAWLSLGLDPQKVTFYRQSKVPAVCELVWYLSCFTPYPMLANAHAFKDKSDRVASVNVGLFTYPILMAADILLYQADIVPVGKDQLQHLEIARDIAASFNHQYGPLLRLPQAQVDPSIAIIPGTDGQKMSKSYHNTIDIFLPEKELRQVIMRIPTDSKSITDPKDPATCTVFKLYSFLADATDIAKMRHLYVTGGIGYGQVKEALFKVICEQFAQERAQYATYVNNTTRIEEVLRMGEAKAQVVANHTLGIIREQLGY